MTETQIEIMKTKFFLYDYSLEEKQRFLDKVVGNLEDLIFVFELNSNQIIFHNNAFNSNSNWDVILSNANLFDAIKVRLSSKDLPALQQLIEKIYRLEYRDYVVRELHIKNKEQLYCLYQIEMSLFDSPSGSPSQVMCKVHTLQDQLKGHDLLRSVKGFSTIVLIDDDVLTNILNEKIIKTVQQQVEVVVFLSVDEALEWLKANDECGDYLIFLDINFPGKNGWDFMRSYNEYAIQSKVIVLSSSIVPGDKVKAYSYKSVIQYMCKPLSFEIVESILN
jgi:CheY-like chemotaxis protein